MLKNKELIKMNKDITEYKAVIFDMDGTLYFQPQLRRLMASRLFKYYIRHPFSAKELLIIKKYRHVREYWHKYCKEFHSANMEDAQYEYVGTVMNTSAEKVRILINTWIYENPLLLLEECRDVYLSHLINQLRKINVKTAVYSDYPVDDKLSFLKITADFSFCSNDEELGCMKPDSKAMLAVLNKLDVAVEDALMIGDRYEKDGLAAKNTGMDYVILPKSMPERMKLYKVILNETLLLV